MEDLFSKLPAPLQLMILKAIDDPATLLKFIEASPTAAIWFHNCHLELTRTVLANCLHPQVLQLAMALLHKRAQGFGFDGMDSLHRSLERWPRAPIPNGPYTYPLPTNIASTPDAARSVLAAAAELRARTHRVLRRLLDCTNSLPIYRAKGPAAARRLSSAGLDVDTWRNNLAWRTGAPVPVIETALARCAQPAWVEAHRAHRAVWRVALYREHLDVAPTSRSAFFVARPRRTHASEGAGLAKFWRRLPPWEVDEAQAVDSAYDGAENEDEDFGSGAGQDFAIEGLLTPQQPLDNSLPHECPVTHRWDDDWQVAERQGPAWDFVVDWGLRHRRSLIDSSDLAFFKWAGLNLWDRDRLAALGLVTDTHKLGAATPNPKAPHQDKLPSQYEMGLAWKMMAKNGIPE